MIMRKNTFYTIRKNIKSQRGLHRGVTEHRKECRLCSGILGYHQKRESASNYTAKMTAIKIAMKEIHKRKTKY